MYNIYIVFYTRFKTRNTYKRHLKTRHGKILTTIGEVLHLSEEDFQKVRTNRRKKDCIPETAINVDNVESNVLMDFGNHHDKMQITNSVEEYVLKENIKDINRNLETKATTQIVDKCLESFEICSESNKTDGIETEIDIDCRYSDKNDRNVKVERINDVEDDLLQLKSPYDNLKTTNDEENHIIYQHNIEDQEVYDCSNRIQWLEYSEIKCNNEILKKEDEEIENKINTDLSELHKNKLQESIHNYHKIVCDNDTQEKTAIYVHLKTEQAKTSSNENNQTYDEKYNGHIIITQNNDMNEKSNKYANTYNVENKECIEGNSTLCTQIINADINILQTFNAAKEEIMPQNQDNNILQENKCLSESIATDSIETVNVSSKNSVKENQEIDQQNNQCLYVHADQLNRIIAQSRCINIPLHQIELYRDKQNQLQTKTDNCRKIRILDGNLQAIDIKQSDKQNTILFVSNDHLKNGIFQIDKNSIRYCQSSKKMDNFQN